MFRVEDHRFRFRNVDFESEARERGVEDLDGGLGGGVILEKHDNVVGVAAPCQRILWVCALWLPGPAVLVTVIQMGANMFKTSKSIKNTQ